MYDYKVPELSETMREIRQLAKQIRDKKIIMKEEARVTKASTKPVMPRTTAAKLRDRSVAKLKEQMEDLGVDMEDTKNVSIVNFLLVDKYISGMVIIYNCSICMCVYNALSFEMRPGALQTHKRKIKIALRTRCEAYACGDAVARSQRLEAAARRDGR